MDYLGQKSTFTPEFWSQMNKAVVESASRIMVGRRLITIKGPMGSGTQFVKIDRTNKSEEFIDGFVKTTGRQLVELPQLYSDFHLYWRDLAGAAQIGIGPDVASAAYAAHKLAQHEDRMIFHGIPALGLEGLLTVKGAQTIKYGDWGTGETAFIDISAAITKLEQAGFVGSLSLVVSPDIFQKLQRIQPGTGVLEVDRIKSLVGKQVYKCIALEEKTAVLFSNESYCMDLVVGQDVQTAYVEETADMNHHFRILETILLRIKCPEAIVTFK